MTKSTKKTNRNVTDDMPSWRLEALALETDLRAEEQRGYTSVASEALALESYFRSKKLP